MCIAYTTPENPKHENTYNTCNSRLRSLGLLRTLGEVPTQAEWDKHELALLREDQQKGTILSFRVVEGV